MEVLLVVSIFSLNYGSFVCCLHLFLLMCVIVCLKRPKVDIDVSAHSVQLPLLVYCLLRLRVTGHL